MAELLINEFFSTYPFHMFAYLPFHTNLRYPGKITILLSALAEIIYLAVFAILVMRGFQPYLYSILRFPFWDFFSTIWFRQTSESSHSSTPLSLTTSW